MPILDLTFNNPLIKGFFESETPDYVPTSELVHVHTHFTEDNFVSQIEAMILQADRYFMSTTKKRGVAEKIRRAAEELSKLVNPFEPKNAEEMLKHLKVIYQNCKLVNQTSP